MTPEREAELFARLDLMLELHRRTERDIQGLQGELRDVRAEMRDLRKSQQDLADRVSRVDGRLEEQSKFLQLALAGRLPRKPAA